ncbi:MAG: U32 family peptidase, partial [Caldilineaceae bacterium]
CVSYSGQCFSSEAWGGRSANRGQCAQACRLPYELIVDDVVMPLADKRYLLSPGDLYALRQMPEIVRLGVSALKLEGRYKDADYVALTTAAYRQAVDEAWSGLPLSLTQHDALQLEQVYSRGLGPWFVSGTNHQTVVNGRAPRHRGLLMGRVERVDPAAVVIAPEPYAVATGAAPLKPGDGLVFDAADWRSPQEPEEGGRVYEIFGRKGGRLELRFGNGAVRFDRIRAGDKVWRSHDPETDRVARPYLEAETPLRRQPLFVEVTAREGEPLVATFALAEEPSIAVTVRSPEVLVAARAYGLDAAVAREQLGRLGGSAYQLAELHLEVEGTPFVPVSLLNTLRREAVAALVALQEAPPTFPIAPPLETLAVLVEQGAPVASPLAGQTEPALH